MKPKRFVRMFQPQFAEMVLDGRKRRTIRPMPSRIPRVGDVIDCRMWEGKPYRSKQQKLIEATLLEVKAVWIGIGSCQVTGGKEMNRQEREEFARLDGFKDWAAMEFWFVGRYRLKHGETFLGLLLVW